MTFYFFIPFFLFLDDPQEEPIVDMIIQKDDATSIQMQNLKKA